MPRTTRPTDLELEILKALWERGPSTVREVQEQLGGHRRAGYTTVLKMLQIMAEKGLVLRDESGRAHIYRSRESRRAVLGRLAKDLLERAFDGSTQQLMLHALDRRATDPEELAELRRLLEQLAKGKSDG